MAKTMLVLEDREDGAGVNAQVFFSTAIESYADEDEVCTPAEVCMLELMETINTYVGDGARELFQGVRIVEGGCGDESYDSTVTVNACVCPDCHGTENF